VTFTSVYLAAGALMPLLVVYKERWALPATLLTLAFAVFAVGFLVAVLILGRSPTVSGDARSSSER